MHNTCVGVHFTMLETANVFVVHFRAASFCLGATWSPFNAPLGTWHLAHRYAGSVRLKLGVPIIPSIADPVRLLLSCHSGLSSSSCTGLLAPVIVPLPSPTPAVGLQLPDHFLLYWAPGTSYCVPPPAEPLQLGSNYLTTSSCTGLLAPVIVSLPQPNPCSWAPTT